jgi:hypothetical protein
MSTQNSYRTSLPFTSIGLATLAAVAASCGADSAPSNVIPPPNMPWSASLTGTGVPPGSAPTTVASDSFSVPSTYKTPGGQVANTGHLVIEYLSQTCSSGAYATSVLFAVDSGPSVTTLSGAMVFTGLGGGVGVFQNASSLMKVYFSAGDSFHLQWIGPGTCTYVLFGELVPN